jgi:hypothetical protein
MADERDRQSNKEDEDVTGGRGRKDETPDADAAEMRTAGHLMDHAASRTLKTEEPHLKSDKSSGSE